jgi:hypothetical protein
MVERRWGKRFHTEIKARFGEKELDHFGWVQDMSIFGFFIVTRKSYPIGTLLKIELITKGQKSSALQGTVQWSKEKPQASVWLTQDGGLGIQIKTFLQGQEYFEDQCQKLCRECAAEVKSVCPIQPEDSEKKIFAFLRNIFSAKD